MATLYSTPVESGYVIPPTPGKVTVAVSPKPAHAAVIEVVVIDSGTTKSYVTVAESKVNAIEGFASDIAVIAEVVAAAVRVIVTVYGVEVPFCA